jgi:hypothetical protein
MEKCIVLSARRYSFRDDAGKQVDGVTLNYLTGDVEKEQDRLGMEPITITGGLDLFPVLQAVPGVYEMDFKQRPGPRGRPTLQVTGVRFVSPARVVAAQASEAK